MMLLIRSPKFTLILSLMVLKAALYADQFRLMPSISHSTKQKDNARNGMPWQRASLA